MSVVILSGIGGFLYAHVYAEQVEISGWVPENVTEKKNFYKVGIIHNFSYLGGLIGLLMGVVYSIRKRKLSK